MNFTEKIEEILQKEAQAILDIPVTDQFEKAVELIVEQVHRKGGKLVTSGMGKAGQIAMNIATTFCSTGTPAVFLHPSEAQHGDLGILQKNDLMLVISNSGKTREILELLQLASNLMPELKFIVITGNNRSELAQRADVCLFTGAPQEEITKNHPNVSVVSVDYQPSKDDDPTEEESIEAVLEKYPDLKGYYATNQATSEAVLSVLDKHTDRSVQMIGVDMGDTQKKAIEDGKEVGSVCQNPYGMGYATIVAGARASLGLESDKKIDSGFQWIDKNTIGLEEYARYLY